MRVVRRFAKLLPLVGVALPLLLAWLLLSPRGGRFLGEKIVAKVNAAIPGKIAIGTFRIGPGLAIHADEVTLLTAEGEKALEAREVAAAVDATALLTGKRVFYVDVKDADVDLSPDALGRPALLRALSSGTAQQQTQSGGARFTVDVDLENAKLVRHVYVSTTAGVAQASAPPKGLDLDQANVALRFAGEGQQWRMSLDGRAQLNEPLSRAVLLHAVLEKGADAITVRTARVAAGETRVAIDAGAYVTAAPEKSSGQIAMQLAPDDVEFFGKVRPAHPLEVHAAAGPVDDRLVAAATVSVSSSGEIALSVVREATGVIRGEATVIALEPDRWAGPNAPVGRLNAAASFARAIDGAIAARVLSANGRVGQAQLEDLAASAHRDPNGDVVATLERFAARDRQNGLWSLLAPARLEKTGAEYDVARLTIAGPGSQRLAVDGHWPPRSDRPLLASVEKLELPGLAGELSPKAQQLAGTLDARARLESLPKKSEPSGNASLRWRNARYGTRGPGDVIASARFASGRVGLTLDAKTLASEHFKLQADAPLHYPGRRDHATLRASLSGVQLKSLHEITGVLEGGFSGERAWATLDAKGREGMLAKLAATADIDWPKLRNRGAGKTLADLPPLALTIDEVQLAPFASAGLLPRETGGKLTGAVAVAKGQAHARLLLDGARIRDVEGITLAMSGHADGASARVFTRLRAASGGDGAIGAVAQLSPRGFTDVAHIGWQLKGAVTGVQLGEASGKGKAPVEMRTAPPLEGTLDTALAFAGLGKMATGWLYLRTNDLALSGNALGTTVLAARVSSAGAAAWLGGRPPAGGRLAAFVRAEGAPATWAAQKGGWRAIPIFASLFAEAIPLEPLGAYFKEQVGSVGGRANARGVVRGTAGTPDPHVRLEIHDGSFVHVETGRIHGIEVVAAADNTKIKLEKLEAHAQRGSIKATATAVHIANDWKLNALVNADRFGLKGQRFAGEVEGEAHVSGALTWPQLTAEVRIPHGVVRLPAEPAKNVQPLNEHPDFIVIRDGDTSQIQRVAGHDASTKKGLAAAIHLIVPNDFWVKGNDVNVELKGNLWARIDPAKDAPQLEGEVEAIRGEAAVAGKRFTVQTARVTFPGGPIPTARLDIHAEHEMDDIDSTKVYAGVGGSIGDPKIELTSDPPLPQNAIASLLFLGNTDPRSRPSSSDNPSLAGRAATFVGNYLTSELRKNLQTVIPVDVLEFDPGANGSTASGRLRVGKYIAPGLFLVYAHAFGASAEEGSNALRLEYRFAKVWSLLSEYTDRNRGSVDVVWKKEF